MTLLPEMTPLAPQETAPVGVPVYPAAHAAALQVLPDGMMAGQLTV